MGSFQLFFTGPLPPELFINMIFLTGFNAICIEIRDMYRFSEIGNVSLDFTT